MLDDISERRRAEEIILESLREKEVLLKEIHHRVKNNLQTVAAMLRLQARRATSAEVREALAEAELRVAAIAVVHESLSSDAGESVDFDEIVDRVILLVRDLAPAFAEAPLGIARVGSSSRS